MRRRGKAKRALGKGVSPNARKVPIARGSTARVQEKLDRALRERDEALEQQAATAEVLNVISGSPGQLEPVFQTILANATRICGAKFGTLYLRVGDSFRAFAAFHNAPLGHLIEARKGDLLIWPDPGSTLGQAAATKRAAPSPRQPPRREAVPPAPTHSWSREQISEAIARIVFRADDQRGAS